MVDLKKRKSDLAFFDESANAFVEENIEYTALNETSFAEEAFVRINFRY